MVVPELKLYPTGKNIRGKSHFLTTLKAKFTLVTTDVMLQRMPKTAETSLLSPVDEIKAKQTANWILMRKYTL